MRNRTQKKMRFIKPIGMGACIGTALLGNSPLTYGQAETGNTVRMERLEKENLELKTRLESLENVMTKEGIGGTAPANVVKALSDIQISGFVTSSYFYDTSDPADRKSNGYLWNTSEDSFSINKVKLTIASSPVERSGEKWGAAYRASFIFGEDAPIVNTGGESQGLEDLREAYVELNAPLGSGLNIKAGQLISLLNYESGDGGAANPNFSQGYQWYYTGNGPAAGVQLGYTFTDWLDVKVRVQNGLYTGAIDNNSGKTFMGSLGIKPIDKLWLSLIGFGGDDITGPGIPTSIIGGSLLAGYQFTDQLGTGLEFDYFSFDRDAAPFDPANLWSIGGWLTYDFNATVGLALRAEYLDDQDGFGINGLGVGGRAGSAIMSADADGDLSSLTLTLNYKPLPNVKIQPEIRYDHTSYDGGFDGQDSRFMVGAGISYLF
jgi:hypothetical protein